MWFCIPGMVIAAESLFGFEPSPHERADQHGISGNRCDATGYDLIVDSIKLASEQGDGLW